MQIFTKKKKGFTLIELLVVIAIIGILAAIVLVALAGARDKAKDARIIASMNQLRNVAEMYKDTKGTYGDAITNFMTGGDGLTLVTDIGKQTANTISSTMATSTYCAEIKLNSTASFCIDSDLRAVQKPDDFVNCPSSLVGTPRCE